jgi:hypothetical protein
MNRLIHRSWGEGFVNIFLDLCIQIFHFLPSQLSLAQGGIPEEHILKAVRPIGVRRWDEIGDRNG